MRIQSFTQRILQELSSYVERIQDEDFVELLTAIQQARHIFLSGAGRSGLCVQAFANRLLHLNFRVSVVGEITAPHAQKDDVLILASGSGETPRLVALAHQAKRIGLPIACITLDSHSTLAQLSSVVIVLPGTSPKRQPTASFTPSFQPMGSAYEQFCFLIYDAIVLELMDQRKITSEQMFQNHANLE